jgi:hypothetical protein
MKQESTRKPALGWLAFAGVASIALVAAWLWSSPSGSPRGASTKTSGEEQGAPERSLAPASPGASPRLLPVRQWKPGDTFVYDVRSERLIGVDTSKVASARGTR